MDIPSLIMTRVLSASALPRTVAVLATAALLIGVCGAIDIVHHVFQEPRLALTYLLVPVAFGAAVFGTRGATAVTIITLLAARILMSVTSAHGWRLDIIDTIDFGGLTVGAVIVLGVVGHLRLSLDALKRMHEDLRIADQKLIESEEKRISTSREVLAAVTGSRLIVCDDREFASMIHGTPLLVRNLISPRDVTETRAALKQAVCSRHLLERRLYDFEACTTEATTNALKHGAGGKVELYIDGEDVYVLVQDNGSGIAHGDLARATLEKGFSTRVSLGMGFKMMWEMADMLAVCTGEHGTRILLRINEHSGNEFEQMLLNRYPGIEN
ncbi:MAG: ATP-binding protein [Capsulimonadaceae bacterium]|nr:ATP-binding protein [Capsulimonadaceae bacterium]